MWIRRAFVSRSNTKLNRVEIGVDFYAGTLSPAKVTTRFHCLWKTNDVYDFAWQNTRFCRHNSLRFNVLNAQIAQESFCFHGGHYDTQIMFGARTRNPEHTVIRSTRRSHVD